MLLHRSSFLPTDCNEDHRATLVSFTNLKQKLKTCKYFVNGVCKNSWAIVLFAHSHQRVQSMLKT